MSQPVPSASSATDPPTEQYRRPPRRNRAALGVGAGLVLFGLVVLGAWWVFDERAQHEEPVNAQATQSQQAVLGATSADPAAAAQEPATPATAPAAPPQPPAAPQTPAQALNPGQNQVQVPAAQVPAAQVPAAQVPAGSWILVLESLPKDEYTPDDAEEMSAGLPGSTVIDSSLTPGLNSGYWVVVSQQSFDEESRARAGCGAFGRSPSGSCYPRQVGG